MVQMFMDVNYGLCVYNVCWHAFCQNKQTNRQTDNVIQANEIDQKLIYGHGATIPRFDRSCINMVWFLKWTLFVQRLSLTEWALSIPKKHHHHRSSCKNRTNFLIFFVSIFDHMQANQQIKRGIIRFDEQTKNTNYLIVWRIVTGSNYGYLKHAWSSATIGASRVKQGRNHIKHTHLKKNEKSLCFARLAIVNLSIVMYQ